MSAQLSHNSYGKSEVRLTKVIRNGPLHELIEYSVDIILFGDFDRSYTHGDNSRIIATDSMKNTVYALAKENNFNSPEAFALLLAEHFPLTYSHVEVATVKVRQVNWQRISIDAKPQNHAFVSGGSDFRTARALARRNAATTVFGGITDLLVAKTTQSAFKNFVTDRYRTLKDADDRIFGTAVTAVWQFIANEADFNATFAKVRETLLRVFATHISHAVQETVFEMGKAALATAHELQHIHLQLPNKHRIPINLEPFNLENHNEIFVWTNEPYGEISATVERE